MPRSCAALVALAGCAVLPSGLAARVGRKAQKVDNDGDGLDDNFEMTCAQKFKPVTYLHTREKYGPGKVEDYLETCMLRRLNSCSSWASLAEVDDAKQESNASRANCPYAVSMAARLPGCWFKDRDDTLGQATAELLGKHTDRNTYVRCLGCSGTKCNDMGAGREGSHGVTTEEALRQTPYYVHVVPQTVDGRRVVNIQYWFFYPFNGPTIGFGVHQGDWEHLAMLVDESCTNRLAYRSSAHGGGKGWMDEGTGHQEFENGALVSYSAVNSHAGFMKEGTHEGGTIITKDETNKGPRGFPDEVVNVGETSCSCDTCRPMSEATRFIDFGGSWGTDSAFDGVLDGVPTIGAICPGGPGWSVNKHTPFASKCRGR